MVLLVGSAGNMGKRYAAILRNLNIPQTGIDIGDNWPDDGQVSHVLVCTPTDTHVDIALQSRLKYPYASIMIEKPVAMTAKEVMSMATTANIYVVNNWAHVIDDEILIPGSHEIYYDYYNTGPHGKALDCCQLIYLSIEPSSCGLYTENTVFDVFIDSHRITTEQIQRSYIKMIECWLSKKTDHLWDMRDAVSQMLEVERYMKWEQSGKERKKF